MIYTFYYFIWFVCMCVAMQFTKEQFLKRKSPFFFQWKNYSDFRINFHFLSRWIVIFYRIKRSESFLRHLSIFQPLIVASFDSLARKEYLKHQNPNQSWNPKCNPFFFSECHLVLPMPEGFFIFLWLRIGATLTFDGRQRNWTRMNELRRSRTCTCWSRSTTWARRTRSTVRAPSSKSNARTTASRPSGAATTSPRWKKNL